MILLPQTLREINFTPLKKEIYSWIGVFSFLLIGVYFLSENTQIWDFLISHQTPLLNSVTEFLTEAIFWGILSILSLFSLWHLAHYKQEQSRVLPMMFSAIITAIFIFILKAYFDYDRPFEALNLSPTLELTHKSGASFPSGHAAVSWALFMPFYRQNKYLGIMKGLDTKQWQIGHITRLRTAGMEDIVIQ